VILLVGARLIVRSTETDPTPVAAATEPADPPTLTTTTSSPAKAGAVGALRFTDITKAAGLGAPRVTGQGTAYDTYTGGAAVADYDQDGDQDIFLTRIGQPNRLMRNDGHGHFTDVAGAAGVGGLDTEDGSSAAVWADVDGDGRLDLFTTGAGFGPSHLYRNEGDGSFGTIRGSGIDAIRDDEPVGTASFGAAFDDWNHDGTLDLVVTQWFIEPFRRQALTRLTSTSDPKGIDQCRLADERRAQPWAGPGHSETRLFANDGHGHFTDVTAASGVDVDHIIGMQPRFSDVDGDGWDDLFLTGDFCTSRLYRNDRNGHFTDITRAAHVGTDEDGMGSVIEDLDGDGRLDWFVTAIEPLPNGRCPDDPGLRCSGNRAYLGDGRGHFTDGTDRLGLRNGSWGWGAAAADLDDDGHLDIVEADGIKGLTDSNSAPIGLAGLTVDPNRLWRGQAHGTWPEVAVAAGLTDRGSGKAVVATDIDGDLDLDLLIVNSDTAPVLYRNDTPETAANHRLVLRLRQRGANPYAIGARLTIDVGDGTPPRPVEVRAGGSYSSGDPTDVHIGLGRATTVRRITIRWPGSPAPQVLTDVRADQLVAVTRP
jgi:hypothetical protein